MELDCVDGLYAALGKSAGSEFTPDDVSFLFHRVFHVPSSRDEVCSAMEKVLAGGSSRSCAGERVLDVLLQLEREKEDKEKMFWEHQLLRAGKQSGFFERQQRRSDPSRAEKPLKSFHTERHRLAEDTQKRWSIRALRRLKRSVRQTWARLASDGIQSILSCACQGSHPGVIGQAWGWVSVSDVLMLVEVKYDVVAHLLYTEMLQEHYIEDIWENMSPCQRQNEEMELEDFAEEALECGDLLRLAQLPGSLRIQRVGRAYWSSASLLWRLHSSRQRERAAVTALGESLNTTSLRLMCLHVRGATLRAQREKESYRALLAAEQSWESWPRVDSPCREELAASCLHREDDERPREVCSASPQQATLQMLLLSQEEEREQLVQVMRSVSLEDLRTPDHNAEKDLKSSCVEKLLQVHQRKTDLQDTPQSEDQLEDVKVQLLTQLLELQEAQTSVLLQSLTEQSLLELHESHLQGQTDLLLTSRSEQQEEKVSSSADGQNQTVRRDDQESDLVLESAAESSDKETVCSGCGLVMEELPYLEISCSDEPRVTQGAAEERPLEGEECSAAENLEKQASLITLAWSKPAEDDLDGSRECGEDQTPVQSCDQQAAEGRPEDLCGSAGHNEASSAQPTILEETQQTPDHLTTVDEVEENISPEETGGSPPELAPVQAGAREPSLLEREREPVLVLERERTMQNLVDLQRKVEQKHQRDRERQLLRVQERLSIIQSRKAEEDVLGLKHGERLRHLTQDLEQEDREQQKTLVRERLEQLRRERSYVMQSKRERNTAGFKELLNPVHRGAEDDAAV